MVGVVAWGVEDGDADEAAGVDYGLWVSIGLALFLSLFLGVMGESFVLSCLVRGQNTTKRRGFGG